MHSNSFHSCDSGLLGEVDQLLDDDLSLIDPIPALPSL